jgi:DHA1 family multidrug resistance protein-like MFS transporter
MTLRLSSSALLLMCGFLFVFTETILSPFYPQFFKQVFGVNDLELTGHYVAMCRLTVLVSAPFWGFIARYIDPIKLLVGGQSIAAVITLCLSFSSSLPVFMLLTVLLLLFKSSYFLFYSLLIEMQGKDKQSSTVGQVQLVVHAALIASTLASAWVLSFDHPLQLFVVVAVLDTLLVLLCVVVLFRRRGISIPQKVTAMAQDSIQAWRLQTILGYGLLVLAFSVAINSIRPYLTVYSMQTLHVSRVEAAFLYLMPSLMAILAFPLIRSAWMQRLNISHGYAALLGLLVSSLVWQAMATDIYALFAARMLFGLSMLLGQALLELYLFSNAAHSPHWYFGLASSVQHAGQLLAPLCAAVLVGLYGLTAPFWLAAAVLVFSGLWVFIGLSQRPSLQRSLSV